VLSGIGELLVIARGTARSYAGRDVDPRQIGRDLGVDCVLSGHVAVHGDTVRVSTELAETASGRVIRSGRYQSTQRGMFALQDQIAEEVVAIAAPAVKAHVLERAKRKPPGSLTAYELMLQGIELQYALDPASFAQSGQRLREAIALDPSYAPSCAHAAFWHMFNVGQGWSADPAEDNRLAGHFASKAIGLDPNNAVAHAVQGHVLGVSSRDYASARQHLDRATLLGPSSVQAWTLSAVSHSWTGKGGLGVEHATHAMRLSPHDPFVFFTEHALSQSHYVLGNHDVAIAMARNVARLKPSLTSNLRTLTASLVAAGQMPAARDMATQILAIQPNFRLAAFAQQTPLDQPVRDIFVERLRLAGLPE
jgi:tetratricopeptide (TPR) repeat protein